jgi:deoxyribonuclease V
MARRRALHSWDLTTAEARDLQLRLAGEVDSKRALPQYTTVAGADVSYNRRGKWLHAAVVVLRAETFEMVDRSGVVAEAKFPYVPGLLTFREAPAVIEAFEQLTVRPDILMCDGQGIAHPRRMGLAAHLGLYLGLPTIGCAKSWLCGEYDEPGLERGDWAPLTDKGETIGAVVRTRAGVKPMFISPGHLCDLASAIAVVLATSPTYRLPITSRLAHQYVNELRRMSAPEEAPVDDEPPHGAGDVGEP